MNQIISHFLKSNPQFSSIHFNEQTGHIKVNYNGIFMDIFDFVPHSEQRLRLERLKEDLEMVCV